MEKLWDELIRLAIREDYDGYDPTSEAIFSPGHKSIGEIVARQTGILSGTELAERTFKIIDESLVTEILRADGEAVNSGDSILRVTGATRSVLAGERIALNFLMRMSGIATATNKLQEKLKSKGLSTRVADTRKTTPLWRFAEKKAVRDGGGINHRMGLFDSILIKDNHIKLVGSAVEAVKRALANARHIDTIEVEVTNLSEIEELLKLGVDAILLDNFRPDEVKEAVRIIAGRAKVEVSGGVTPENFDDYAISGVDVISLGWLTHSAPALNFSLEIISEVKG
mgnify:CR=1 FL=1